jgi:hypothetical protein
MSHIDNADVIANLRAAAQTHRDRAAKLQAQYPGVRPGWVSGDLAHHWEYAKMYDRAAAKAEQEAKEVANVQ